MKLYKYILIGCLAGTSMFTSCYDMDVFPQDKLGPSLFWKNEADIQKGVAGVYSKLYGGYMGWSKYLLEGITDNAYCKNGDQAAYRNMQMGVLEATSSGPIVSAYSDSYKGIAACNMFLKNFSDAKQNAKLSEEKASQYEAEVRFIRALCYFELVQRYGDVPLYKEAISVVEESKIKQSPANEVLAFIHEDLDYAITYLEDKAYSDGHAVKASAQALKARVALFQKDWPTVKSLTDEIIASNKYRLADNYNSLFIKREGQLGNPEIIFSVNYLNPDVRHNAEMELYYWNAATPTDDLMACYEEGDKRKKEWYVYAGVGNKVWTNPFGEQAETNSGTETGWILVKHLDKNNPETYKLTAYDFRTDNNVIVLRYADVLLMNVEAVLELNGGTTTDSKVLGYINEIRKRAGISLLTSVDLSQLYLERRRELAYEGLRHFDLIRTGQAETVMNNLVTPAGKCSFKNHFYQWPFPQSEMDANPMLDQKPGY